MLTDVARYEADRKERWERRRVAGEFREPDRVPVCFGIGASYYCWLFGTRIHEYYATPEMQPEVQLRGIEWEYEALRADSSTDTGLRCDIGPLAEAIVFGADVARPEDTSPRIEHMVHDARDIEKLKHLDPARNPRLRDFFRRHGRFNATARKMGVKLALNDKPSLGIHPPLSCACALMSPTKVYEMMYTEPDLLRRFLDKCWDAFCAYSDYFDRLYGRPRTRRSVGLCDDNISQISADMFRRFEMPYYHKLRERHQAEHFGLHTDGPNDQHFKLLADEVKLTSMDIGGYSKLANAVRDMKGKVVIYGGLRCWDFYAPGRMTSETRRKVIDAIRLAAPGGGFELAIGGETYVGVSPEGICDLVRFVKQWGGYPIQIPDDAE
ncbi:MAG TPA: uroporphyrinogen decarboxylase family protein [Planctomycetota bacterium]|nr:uroporphyrinogen decarboxylase family protein [Planctomycetota bacterium]